MSDTSRNLTPFERCLLLLLPLPPSVGHPLQCNVRANPFPSHCICSSSLGSGVLDAKSGLPNDLSFLLPLLESSKADGETTYLTLLRSRSLLHPFRGYLHICTNLALHHVHTFSRRYRVTFLSGSTLHFWYCFMFDQNADPALLVLFYV